MFPTIFSLALRDAGTKTQLASSLLIITIMGGAVAPVIMGYIADFSKTYPSFLTLKEGSTSHPCPLSSGAREETALLGARNRFALRLADHQRSSPYCAGWDRLTIKTLYKHVVGDEEVLLIANRIKTVTNTMSMFYYIEYCMSAMALLLYFIVTKSVALADIPEKR